MRIKDTAAEEESPVNMTPIIDIVFNLLIFFLVATTMAQEERDASVKLPVASPFKTLSAPPQQIIINIRQDGTKIIASKPYTDAELEAVLAETAKDPEKRVLIRADRESFHKHFADVALKCKQVGISEMKIGYVLEQPK